MASRHSNSGAVSEARPRPGPRNHPPEWKGMGPARSHCPTSHPHQHRAHDATSVPLPAATTTSSSTSPSSSSSSCPALAVPARLLLLLFILTSCTWISVSGFKLQGGSQCQIDQCWHRYKDAIDALDLSGGVGTSTSDADNINGNGPLRGDSSSSGSGSSSPSSSASDIEAHCVALRTYWNCIKTTKNTSRGCHGNINYYHVRNGLKKHLRQYNCTTHGPTMDPVKQLPPPPRQIPPQCEFHGARVFRHCGLFGDPHLRTFDNQFQTCKVKGAWPLVDNKYLTVMVTNDPVLGGEGEATATSKLTVMVKSNRDCGSGQYHTYQAQTDSLPSAFEDGNTSIGPHGTVQIKEMEANRHVEIHVHYIATTIVVRQIGRYFTSAIHMPQELANASRLHGEIELCSKGCPVSERINYKQYLAQRRDTVTRIQSEASGTQVAISRFEAEAACRESGLVDFYFDSCVFDLMSTGDKNFTVAALSALKDALRLDPAMAPLANRTSLQPYDDVFGGAASALSRTVSLWWHAVCVMSVLLTLWQHGVGVVVVR